METFAPSSQASMEKVLEDILGKLQSFRLHIEGMLREDLDKYDSAMAVAMPTGYSP